MQNPYLSLLGTAWKYARRQKKRFLLIYGMFIIANMVVTLHPLLYGWFIDSLQREGTKALSHGWIYVAGFLGLRLAEWIFHGPARVMERKLAFQIGSNFLDDLFHKVLHLPAKWHQDHHSGSTINKLRKAHEALRDFFQQGFIYVYSIGKFVFSFAAMLYFSPLFGGIGILLGVATVYIIVKFDKPYIKGLREVNAKEHEVSSNLFDSLSNIITVITLRLENRMQKGLLAKVSDVRLPFVRTAKINEWKWFTAQMMVGLIYCVITIGFIYQQYTPGQPFMVGGLVILLGYIYQFTSVFTDISAQYTQIVRFHTEVQNVQELEEDYASLHRPATAVQIPEGWRSVTVGDLNFSRSTENESGVHHSGLQNIRMQLARGKRTAVIGESGCGKSTLLSLLRGLYTPAEGAVLTVDDKTKVSFQSLCDTVTLFPQDPEIFENTILYNITLGLDFDEDEVMRVCEQAHFASVVRKLPNGLHTHIKEKGVNLSGGQKQRLALARGILAARGSDIVLMDEPTSSVDPRTEKMVYRNLFSSFRQKAVISSLHRLHLLPYFDYIYIMRDGTIVDEGGFEDLKRRSLVFKELWDYQSAGGDEADYPRSNHSSFNEKTGT